MTKPLSFFLSTMLGGLALWTTQPSAALAAARSNPTNPPAKLSLQGTPLNRDLRAPVSFAPVVKKVAPSVVNISSSMTIRERSSMNPFNDPLLRRFSEDDFGEQFQPRPRKAQSLGSGVIVSPEGYILTANHVVEGADSVKVALADGKKEFGARIVGTDPATDVAVLKVESGRNLPAVTLADSDKLEVGDVVLAVGNPFDVGQTVTMGIISALGRSGLGMNGYENFIQTDAAINLGNSGGALVDTDGRLVGINTAILSRSGGSQGVGFAVPINMARDVMERLIAHGKVTRGYLGIALQSLTPELAKRFGLPDDSSGALVGEALPNTAASAAGLQAGDVIVELNGRKVSDSASLRVLIAQTAPGAKVTLRVLRVETGAKPSERNLTATLGEQPPDMVAGLNRSAPSERGQKNIDTLDGVEVTDLDAPAHRQFRLPSDLRGALVVNVDPDSDAADKLRPGDVILEINREPVRSADEAVALSEKAKGQDVLLRVWSRAGGGPGGSRYIVLESSKPKEKP